MSTAEAGTKVNNPTSNGASATKQALRFYVKSMSKVCQKKMMVAKEVEGYVSV